jgi:hypothetical protein
VRNKPNDKETAMARRKSEFLKALGTMFEIWKALTEEVLSRQGTDEDIRRIGTDLALRAHLAQIIVERRHMSNILSIDRTKPFNPAEFIGEGLEIAEEDERSLILSEVNLSSIRFEHTLKQGETWVEGEEKLQRLKDAGYVRLDAKIFQTLWENQHLIPEAWKDETNGHMTFIFFDGTVLRRPDRDRVVLYLFWDDGRWLYRTRWYRLDCTADDPSAVLANSVKGVTS